MITYRIISEKHGLVATIATNDREVVETTAIVAAVNSGRTVYLQEGTTP